MEYQIDGMQQLFNNELPGYSYLIWTILIGLLIGLAYVVIKRILLPTIGQGRKARQWHLRLDIIERLYPPILTIAVLASILVSRPLVGIAVTTILVLLLYKPMKNYILGVIYHAGNIYSIGQRIIVQNQHGSIHSFNALSLGMELEDGSMLDIPYDIFSSNMVVRSSPKSGVLSHSIELSISKPCDIDQVKESIRVSLLSMPYVLPNQKITIEHLFDEEDRYLIKVIIHGLDKQQMYKVEGRLKAKFTKVDMKKVS